MTAPVLPQIIVEVAMNPAQPVSGPGSFTLNSASFGILNTDFLGQADAWTDITRFVYNFTITRGSSREQGPLIQFEAGTISVEIDNSDGRFDPDNLSGPYVSGGVSQVRTMIPLRVRALWGSAEYPLFRGFVDSWQEPQVTFVGQESIWTVTATDGFKILAGLFLATTGSQGAGEDTGARINRILSAANWYTTLGGGGRKIPTGNSTLQGTTLGGFALDLLQVSADSEIGQIFIDGSGAFVFHNRQYLQTNPNSASSVATFGDNPTGTTELPCAIVGRADDDTTIGNDIQGTRVGGTMQEVTDPTSIATYLFPRTYSRTDLILQTDVDVLNWANWILYVSKTGEDRFDSIAVDPQFQPLDLWPQVLGREIGDRITGVRRPPGVTTPITKDVFISGITHTFDATASTWQTQWSLQDASKYGSFFTLNNAVTGTLNHNALDY